MFINANPRAQKIHLILDNAGYHKSKKIVSFVADTKVQPHYLPPYSPNLNPIECLWKVMHENVTYNQYYPKLADFTEAIFDFFGNLDKYKNILKSTVSDDFQKLNFA